MYKRQIEDSPNEKKKLEFDQQIQSVFENEDYVGYIINNSANPEKGKYILQVYNKKGARKLNHIVDMNYDSISMWGKEIIAVRGKMCIRDRYTGGTGRKPRVLYASLTHQE